MDPSMLIFNLLMAYFVRSKADNDETMPSGRRAKKKQQKRNRKRRQLLERSRRSRDDLINSALEETDVVAFVPTPRSVLNRSHRSSFCDVTDGSFLGTPSGDNKARGRTLFINSTPRRRISYSPSPSRFRSPQRPTSLLFSPVVTVEEAKLCGREETDSAPLQLACITSSTDKPEKTVLKLFNGSCVKGAFVTLLNTVTAYIWKIYLSFTTATITRTKKLDCSGDAALTAKLDQILQCINEISIKQDKFNERQENLFNRLSVLEAKMSSSAPIAIRALSSGAPPPPPPPPPPMPIFKAAEPLEIIKKPQNQLAVKDKGPSRPSITLEDILGVQLKKTPAVRPYSDRTPSKGSGLKGPLVSVDMIRSVKLKPTTMRRQSLERPLQTPSSIFFHSRNPSIFTETESELKI
ncbi:Hypothetical predicted protein [Cloeon dipterum]|uniref:WH2 domain-containing protein n=1 Tax=Cloeon dipterum TaxID=197152 RepID=A0A8S1C8N5_9INSE|nr:Hypothetical predicted protein [Cloeon dipterum]